MRREKGYLAVMVVAVLATGSCWVHAEPAQQASLEVLDVRFEPLQQGKNTVFVEVRNTSDRDQVFRTHIFTRSPEYGGGVGWGTGFFRTIPAGETVRTRLVFKIQGPMTQSTFMRLTFFNPGPQAGFNEEAWLNGEGRDRWLKRNEYQAGDLTWARMDPEEGRPASAGQADVVTRVFRQIQSSLESRDYPQAWQLFTRDYQEAEFQTTDGDRLTRAMEPQRPTDCAFLWEKGPFLALRPGRVIQRAGRLSLLAEAEGRTWTLDFVDEGGQWKVDWIAGYMPRILQWQHWEDHVLPRMEKHSTEHFDLYFLPKSTAQAEIARIAQERENGYTALCGFLENDPKVRIRLVLFEDKATKHWNTGHQGMGWAYGTTIVEVYNEEERLDPFHETVHILMDSVGAPPALFNEGFAVYMSQRLGAHALENLGGGQATIDERARELKARSEWIGLAELMTYSEIGSAESRPSMAYTEAASFVKFLIDSGGKDKFLRAYGMLKNSSNPAVLAQNTIELEALYGRSVPQLRDAWEKAIQQSEE